MGESCREINLQSIQDPGDGLQFIRLYTMRIMGTGKKRFKHESGCQVGMVRILYHYFTVKNGRYTRRGEKKTYVYQYIYVQSMLYVLRRQRSLQEVQHIEWNEINKIIVSRNLKTYFFRTIIVQFSEHFQQESLDKHNDDRILNFKKYQCQPAQRIRHPMHLELSRF